MQNPIQGKSVSDRQTFIPELNKNFRYTEVVGGFTVQEVSKPFKKLKFENTEEIKTENFDYSDSSSEFSFSIEEPRNNDSRKIPKIKSFKVKNNNMQGKRIPERKRTGPSTSYTLSSDSSKLQDETFENEKAFSSKFTLSINPKDKENFPSQSKEYLEFLPSKKFCKKCNCEVNTIVKMEMPTVPFWKRICCSNCEVDALERFQRVLHICTQCKNVIHTVTPSLY